MLNKLKLKLTIINPQKQYWTSWGSKALAVEREVNPRVTCGYGFEHHGWQSINTNVLSHQTLK